MIQKFFEYLVQAQFEPIKSFRLKEDFNRKIWDKDDNLETEIKEQLLQIGQDFYDKLEVDAKLKDIVFCGSLCNYNWSEYSDIDLHLIFDYDDINDDSELVEKFFDYAKKVWNDEHDIQIKGYDVEIAVQNEKNLKSDIEKNKMGGVYSLINDEWIKKPKKEDFQPDEELIRQKSKDLMISINDIESDFEDGVEYSDLIDRIKKVWKKIKDGRKAGLEKEGEFSTENLVFKLLRRNEYIDRLMQVRKKAYDKQFK